MDPADENCPLTIPALLRRHVTDRPDHILLATEDERISYAEADARSRRIARGLVSAGAKKGTNIALLFPGGGDFLACTLAAARIGAVVVPITTLSTSDEIAGLLLNADIAFLLTATRFRSQDYVRLIGAALPDLDLSEPPPLHTPAMPWLRGIWFSGDLPEGSDRAWSIAALEAPNARISDSLLDAIEARVSPADRLAILHTSGSTGKPKGVMHQHGTVIQHHYNVNRARGYGPDDVYFTTFPFFWIAGFAYGLIATLCEGATIVWSNSTVAAETLDLLEREQPSWGAGFWRTVTRLVEDPSWPGRDIGGIRRGNLWPLRAPDARAADPSLRHDIYGMSETGPGVALGPDDVDLPEAMRGSCGRFMPTFETKIVDPTTGVELPRGEAGELWVRGPLMAEGYYGKPRSAVYSIDGWYRTNDLGVIDAEGHFYWKARLGDMIKSAGANVSPKEVESVLATILGNIASIVIGLPDEERGQIVVAVVVTADPVDEATIRKQLAERLSSYKVPRRIVALALDEIPLLSNGKYDMAALTARVAERLGTVAA